MREFMDPAWKQVLVVDQVGFGNPCRYSFTSLRYELELNGPACLLLHDYRTSRDDVPVPHVTNAQADKVTAAQLAVDTEVE